MQRNVYRNPAMKRMEHKMKYKDEFQKSDLAMGIAGAIKAAPLDRPVNLMEVCGTHTHAIARFGIRSMLPEKVKLLSGPGCPVCVTPNEYIDHALALAELPDVIISTFGDMFRVPGSYSSLQEIRGKGADIRISYSPADAVEIAKKNPHRKVIFLGVGFETTAPAIAASVIQAKAEAVENFFVLAGFKTLPNALKTLAELPDLNLHGLICPGHLSIVTGTNLYQEIAEKYNIACVVTGFEALDILNGLLMLLKQISSGRAKVENEYSRIVRPEGNMKAMKIMNKVFQPVDSRWRGIGIIPQSGLEFNEEYGEFDASRNFDVEIPPPLHAKGCICGQILTGTKTPLDCPSFGHLCNPENPIGACMVSSEGTCAAYYRYRPVT